MWWVYLWPVVNTIHSSQFKINLKACNLTAKRQKLMLFHCSKASLVDSSSWQKKRDCCVAAKNKISVREWCRVAGALCVSLTWTFVSLVFYSFKFTLQLLINRFKSQCISLLQINVNYICFFELSVGGHCNIKKKIIYTEMTCSPKYSLWRLERIIQRVSISQRIVTVFFWPRIRTEHQWTKVITVQD